MTSVALVVLNWNRPWDTLECLDSLLPCLQRHRGALICCDNRSTDNSVDLLLDWAARHFTPSSGDRIHPPGSTCTVIDTGANLGYAGGNNVGIRHALASGDCAYVWVLNNDVVVDGGALTELLECASRRPASGALGPTVVRHDDPGVVECAGGNRFHPATTITRPVHGGKPLPWVLSQPPAVDLDYPSGAALFLRSEALRRTGLFDERFFLYYEELDLARRLRAQGFEIGWCPRSIIRHKGGVSTGSRAGGRGPGSWTAHYHENLSTLRFLRRHHPLLLPWAAAFRLAAKLLTIAVRRRWATLAPLLAAYRDFIGGTVSRPSPCPRVLFHGTLPAFPGSAPTTVH